MIRDYFDAKEGKGFAYAYTYPGLNKVLQAAGRLIRTEEDHGVVLLLDDRFLENELQEGFPQRMEAYRPAPLRLSRSYSGVCRRNSIGTSIRSNTNEYLTIPYNCVQSVSYNQQLPFTLTRLPARAILLTRAEAHTHIAGWSSLVARRAHNPEVGGSNPPPATTNPQVRGYFLWPVFFIHSASVLYPFCTLGLVQSIA